MTDHIDIAAMKLCGQVTPDFEVCDDPRTFATDELNRVVFDWFGYVEPYEPSADTWQSMPLRLVHDQGSGWHLEMGCFDFDASDIALLRRAIAAYDEAVGESQG